jgi:hypothetical protein
MFMWYWIKQPCWSYECLCDIESNSHVGLMNVFGFNITKTFIRPTWLFDSISQKHSYDQDWCLIQNHKNIHMTKMAVWFNITKTFTRPRCFLWYWIKQPCWSNECFCDIESNSHLGLMNVCDIESNSHFGLMNVFVILNQSSWLYECFCDFESNINIGLMAVWFHITKAFIWPRWRFDSISH